MAIVKRSRSGKAVLFVDDDGNCFVTSVKYLEGVVSGKFKGFCLLSRFPSKVKEGLFEKSPLVGEKFIREGSEKTWGDSRGVAKLLDASRVIGDLDEW